MRERCCCSITIVSIYCRPVGLLLACLQLTAQQLLVYSVFLVVFSPFLALSRRGAGETREQTSYEAGATPGLLWIT